MLVGLWLLNLQDLKLAQIDCKIKHTESFLRTEITTGTWNLTNSLSEKLGQQKESLNING